MVRLNERNVPEIMDIRQCAEYLGVSAETLYRYASNGVIAGFKLGNRWRFSKRRVDEWIDAQCDKNQERCRDNSDEG